MKVRKVLQFVIVFFLGILPVKSDIIFIKKEVSFLGTSFFHAYDQAPTNEKGFQELKKLIKEEKFGEALQFAFKLLDTLSEDNVKLKFDIQYEISIIYSLTNNYQKSLDYSKRALKTLISSNLEDGNSEDFEMDINLMKTYYNIGSQFFRLEKRDSLPQMLDSAKFYYDKVEKYPSLNDKVLDVKGRTFTNLSGFYFRNEDYKMAEEYAKKAIDIHKKLNNKLSQAGALNNLGNIYLMQESLDMAKTTYAEGIQLIRNDETTKAIEFKADLYNNLAWTMRKLEDYRAYDELEKAYEFTDQIRDKEIKRIIEEITQQYNVEQVTKDAEIDRRNFWIYVIISLLVIVLLGASVWLYSQRKRNLALELEKANMMQKQKVEAVKSESQKRILNAVIEGKEKERKEIAETLHDSVSTLLSSANLHLQASAKQFDGEMPAEITKTRNILSEASAKVRDLSHNLMSAILMKFGLGYAIKDLAEKYSNSELIIETNINNVSRYPEKFELKVYNIIQEFINNILKHSRATYAKVSIEEINKNIVIQIKDNGIGFDMTRINKKEGIGIQQIEARVQLMHGDFNINSGPNKGTEVEISIPTIEVEEQLINV